MKVVTLFGTRPEMIRLSLVIKKLDRFCEHLLVHTGQNFDPCLSDLFIRELEIRQPDFHLGVHANGFAEQAGQILSRTGELLERIRPDRVLVLGDTNSGLAAVVAARLGIRIYHMEAGNRCYDNRVPEEVNRRIIDHCSDILMPYTDRSKDNLLREGIERDRVFVTGNPIYEVLDTFKSQIDGSAIMSQLQVSTKGYFLATLHRSENVDVARRLEGLLRGLSEVADRNGTPMLVSLHPRTADKLERFGLRPSSDKLRLLSPFGFFDFIKLEKNARLVLTDSGTVQEECAILGVPNVTLRDVTERPETLECGSNILSGGRSEDLARAVSIALDLVPDWTPPSEYTLGSVSSVVIRIVLGYSNCRCQHPEV